MPGKGASGWEWMAWAVWPRPGIRCCKTIRQLFHSVGIHARTIFRLFACAMEFHFRITVKYLRQHYNTEIKLFYKQFDMAFEGWYNLATR